MTLDSLKSINKDLYNFYTEPDKILESVRLNHVLDYEDFHHLYNAISLKTNSIFNDQKSFLENIYSNVELVSNILRLNHIYKKLSSFYSMVSNKKINKKIEKVTESGITFYRYNKDLDNQEEVEVGSNEFLILPAHDSFINGEYFDIGSYHVVSGIKHYEGKYLNSNKLFDLNIFSSDNPLIEVEIEFDFNTHNKVAIEFLYPSPNKIQDGDFFLENILILNNNQKKTTLQFHGNFIDGKYLLILGKVIAFSPAPCDIIWNLKNTKVIEIDTYNTDSISSLDYSEDDNQIISEIRPGYPLSYFQIAGKFESQIQN